MYERVIMAMGMPRSGTSWLSQIIDSCPDVCFRLSPLFAYACKNAVNECSDREEYERVFRRAYLLDDEFMTQRRHREAGNYPQFAKSSAQPPVLFIKDTRFHNLTEAIMCFFPALKFVAIVRHPCGAINSWLTTPKEFPRDADPSKEWRLATCRKNAPEEFWGFEDWKFVTRLHLRMEKQYPERFRIVQYEDLVESAVEATKQLFAFLELPYTSQTERFLLESQRYHIDDTHAVYKNPLVKDKWRSQLNPEIQAEIMSEMKGTDLERFLR